METTTDFRGRDDQLATLFSRVEKRLVNEEGFGRQLLMRLRERHSGYCHQLIQYAQLAHVDPVDLRFEGKAAQVVGELQDKHEGFLHEIERSIEPMLASEAIT